MTAAFSMGLPSLSRRTVTSILEVGGGALYLRPRRLESWAKESKLRKSPQRRKTAQNESVDRRCIASIVTVALYLRRGCRCANHQRGLPALAQIVRKDSPRQLSETGSSRPGR